MTVRVSVPGDMNPLNDTLARTIVYGPPVGVTESVPGRRSGYPALGQNSPNPFSASTQIHLQMPPLPQDASLLIYDSAGRLVRTIPVRAAKGDATLTWDGRTDAGLAAGTGLYFYRLSCGIPLSARKMVLVR